MSVNRMSKQGIKQIYISNFTKSRLKEQCYFVTEAHVLEGYNNKI